MIPFNRNRQQTIEPHQKRHKLTDTVQAGNFGNLVPSHHEFHAEYKKQGE